MVTIATAINEATATLANAGIWNSWSNAAFLMRQALNLDYLGDRHSVRLTDAQKDHFFALINERSKRCPAQYLVGRQRFFGKWFAVTPDVHIPRPHAQEFVANLIPYLMNCRTIVEIGTGAGAVGLTVVDAVRPEHAVLTDISAGAISVARTNCLTMQLDGRVDFAVGDGLTALTKSLRKKVSAIFANPPDRAINEMANLVPEAKWEPVISVSSGTEDALAIHKKIAKNGSRFLEKNGILAFHVRAKRSSELERLLRNEGYDVRSIRGSRPTYPATLIATSR